MSFEKNYDWARFILRILTGRNTKIDLSLMQSANVVSLAAGGEKVELVSASPDKVGVIVEGEYRTEVTRDEIVGKVIESVKERNLIGAEDIEKLLQGKDNLFGFFVKLTTFLKKNRQIRAVTNQRLGVGHLNQGVQ